MKQSHTDFGLKTLPLALDVFKTIRNKFVIIGIISILFLSSLPYLLGPGLSTPEPIGPYLNGVFPNTLYTGNALYRPAFSNLTFFLPIVFNQVPNQAKLTVGQLDGKIYWFENNEQTTEKNLMIDLSDQVGMVWDAGLLGMAFHPNFDAQTNPKNFIYVYYSSKDRNGGILPDSYTYQGCIEDSEWGNFLILERYAVNPTSLVADPNTRTKLIVRKMFGESHRGGGLGFGNDGFLYLTTGDQAGWSKAQDITNNMDGGILRIDVDKKGGEISHPVVRKLQDNPIPGVNYSSSWYSNNGGLNSNGEYSGEEYYIPNDNPFLSPSGDIYEEYYGLGLRSPHRMFKDALTGIFYIGDVGLNTHDEINVLQAGKNYGWPEYEGNIVAPNSNNCTSMYNDMDHQGPLLAFPRQIANSITGGFVYRGSENPNYFGKYICADYGTGDELFSVDLDTGAYEILGSFGPANIMSFGQDEAGEIYILHAGGDEFYNTTLYKLSQGVPSYDLMPQKLSETGAFETSQNGIFEEEFSELMEKNGIIPYDLVESFWSDGALKKRWLSIPNDGTHDTTIEQINYSENGDWDFPEGSVLIKHFNLNTDVNDPNSIKKIETRFSVKGDDGKFYFLSYNWNEDQTDAFLQEVGLDENVQIINSQGETVTQVWHFPSQSECVSCHNNANKGALGLRTRYLNKDFTYNDNGTFKVANQLVTLSHLGILDETITDVETQNFLTSKSIFDTNATLDEKARSYLDLNCAYCHRPDTDNRASFDLRLFNTIESSELLTAGILTPLNELPPDQKIVFAGDASKSILFHRMNSTDPSIMMPPLAKTIIDQDAIELIEEWINQIDESNLTNNPNPVINLALLASATLDGSVDEENGRGTPLDILYDPLIDDYRARSNYSEYGDTYGTNAGTVDENDGFFWQVQWPTPKFINYITFGGAYPNQPQEYTMWRVSYLRNEIWHTIDEGQGGWIHDTTPDRFDNGPIFEWGDSSQTPIFAEAIRLQLYSDGTHDLESIHIRGRGGITNQYGENDINAEPKATLIQFLPFTTQTNIDNVVVGAQGNCNPLDNTYTQNLIISHSNVPETGSLIVNGQVFPIEPSPQTITLTGLVSNGLGVEVSANFTDGYNGVYKSDGPLFIAPSQCADNIVIGIDESMIINGDKVMGNGQSIQILEGGSLTINGDLTVTGDGWIELNSTSTKYSSIIITGNVAAPVGSISYNRWVNSQTNRNDLISPPLSNQGWNSFLTDNAADLVSNGSNPTQYLFGPFEKGTTDDYLVYNDNMTPVPDLDSGKGYRAATTGGGSGRTLNFTGSIVTDQVYVDILNDVSGEFPEWNLIGNPYPSYINAHAFLTHVVDEQGPGAEDDITNLSLLESFSAAIYGYDGNINGGYWTTINLINAEETLIAPGQGFFVSADLAMVSAYDLEFTTSMVRTGNSDDFILGRSVSAHLGNIKLQIDNTEDTYITDFYFNTNASSGLDPGYDAAMFGGTAPAFAVYSHLVEDNAGLPMAIQALGPSEMDNVIVPIGIHIGAGKTVTVSISQFSLPSSINVYLEDNVTNTFTLLNNDSYSFTANSNITGTGRFFLRFESSTLSTNDEDLNELTIYNNTTLKELIISGPLESKTHVELFDLKGSILGNYSLDVSNTVNKIDVNQLNTGVYIVKLRSDYNQIRIVKLIIR